MVSAKRGSATKDGDGGAVMLVCMLLHGSWWLTKVAGPWKSARSTTIEWN